MARADSAESFQLRTIQALFCPIKSQLSIYGHLNRVAVFFCCQFRDTTTWFSCDFCRVCKKQFQIHCVFCGENPAGPAQRLTAAETGVCAVRRGNTGLAIVGRVLVCQNSGSRLKCWAFVFCCLRSPHDELSDYGTFAQFCVDSL